MAVTAAQLKAKLTEFATTADATVEAAIAEAELRTNRPAWGVKGDLAVIYMAGHVLKSLASTSSGGGASGPLQSLTAGPVSKTYAVPAFALDPTGSTSYGRLWLELRASLMVPRVF